MNYLVRGAYLQVWAQLQNHKAKAGHEFHLSDEISFVKCAYILSLEKEEHVNDMQIRLNITKTSLIPPPHH